MKALTNVVFKVTLSSMIISAPAMTGSKKDDNSVASKEIMLPYYTAAVIKKFVNYNCLPLFAVYPAKKAPDRTISTPFSRYSIGDIVRRPVVRQSDFRQIRRKNLGGQIIHKDAF